MTSRKASSPRLASSKSSAGGGVAACATGRNAASSGRDSWSMPAIFSCSARWSMTCNSSSRVRRDNSASRSARHASSSVVAWNSFSSASSRKRASRASSAGSRRPGGLGAGAGEHLLAQCGGVGRQLRAVARARGQHGVEQRAQMLQLVELRCVQGTVGLQRGTHQLVHGIEQPSECLVAGGERAAAQRVQGPQQQLRDRAALRASEVVAQGAQMFCELLGEDRMQACGLFVCGRFDNGFGRPRATSPRRTPAPPRLPAAIPPAPPLAATAPPPPTPAVPRRQPGLRCAHRGQQLFGQRLLRRATGWSAHCDGSRVVSGSTDACSARTAASHPPLSPLAIRAPARAAAARERVPLPRSPQATARAHAP
jgi:hypothetical protein